MKSPLISRPNRDGHHDERGVTMVLVAVAMIAIIAMAAWSIDLVTRDAYEPLLPLSVVVHIDYQRAPSVIQRFGGLCLKNHVKPQHREIKRRCCHN